MSLDAPIYNEVRKIDSRAVKATPVANSLADLQMKPFSNYIKHSTTADTYATACNITGKGEASVQTESYKSYNGYVKITIDGVVVLDIFLSSAYTYHAFLGNFKFKTSFKVEHRLSASNGSITSVVHIPYYTI